MGTFLSRDITSWEYLDFTTLSAHQLPAPTSSLTFHSSALLFLQNAAKYPETDSNETAGYLQGIVFIVFGRNSLLMVLEVLRLMAFTWLREHTIDLGKEGVASFVATKGGTERPACVTSRAAGRGCAKQPWLHHVSEDNTGSLPHSTAPNWCLGMWLPACF